MPERLSGVSFSLSRRTLIGAVAVTPALTGCGAMPADEVTALCNAWLADTGELERLTHRWMDLETWLIENHRWFQLSDEDRRTLPEAQELYAIDERIALLFKRRSQLQARLPTLIATDVRGVAAKLAVATKVIDPDDDPHTHNLLVSARRELMGLRCAGCGAALIGGGGA